MRIFKLIDLGIQLFWLITGIIVLTQTDDYIHYTYIVLGSWQLISAFVHFIFKNDLLFSKERRAYHLTLLVFAASIFLIFIPGVGFLYFILVFMIIIPVLILWYMLICYGEYKRISQKGSADLK